MKWTAKKIAYILILSILIIRLTVLMWESPFYHTPQEKLLNVLKGYGIAILVFLGPYYLYQADPERFKWHEGNMKMPYRRYKSREEMIDGLYDDPPEADMFGMQTTFFSEENYMPPDARAHLDGLRKEREAKLLEYSHAIIDYYVVRQQYGEMWTPKDYTLKEFIIERHPGLSSEDFTKLFLIVKKVLREHNGYALG